MDTTRQVAVRDALARHLEVDVARIVVGQLERSYEQAYREVDASTRRGVRIVARRLSVWYRDSGCSFPHTLDRVTEACQAASPVLATHAIRDVARRRGMPACLFQADSLPWRGAWMDCPEVCCQVWYGRATETDDAERHADRFVDVWVEEHDDTVTDDTDSSTSSYESADLEDV
jgi:hypothetical protein